MVKDIKKYSTIDDLFVHANDAKEFINDMFYSSPKFREKVFDEDNTNKYRAIESLDELTNAHDILEKQGDKIVMKNLENKGIVLEYNRNKDSFIPVTNTNQYNKISPDREYFIRAI